MDDSELQRTPNPFSAFAATRAESRRHLAASAKWLLIAIGLFCVLTISQVYLHRAKLSGIVNGFSQQSSTEKVRQLEQLHASDMDGIDGLVSALCDEKTDVSAMAAEMLADLNRQWTTMPADRAAERRTVFANALERVASQLDDRTDSRWVQIQSLAHHAAQNLIDSSCRIDDPAYQSLMKVIAADESRPSDTLSDVSTSGNPLPID
ncbi:MAG: hypothetical protein KDB00_17270, partial [Planctomycetales bacterium]|nr:hypothetical protein [Planctomycetales bacterium]